MIIVPKIISRKKYEDLVNSVKLYKELYSNEKSHSDTLSHIVDMLCTQYGDTYKMIKDILEGSRKSVVKKFIKRKMSGDSSER